MTQRIHASCVGTLSVVLIGRCYLNSRIGLEITSVNIFFPINSAEDQSTCSSGCSPCTVNELRLDSFSSIISSIKILTSEENPQYFFVSVDDSLNSESLQIFSPVSLPCFTKRWAFSFIHPCTYEPRVSTDS